MTDYKTRFRERFYEGGDNGIFCRKHKFYATPVEILAFIDEVVAEERNRREEININVTPFVEQGRAEERDSIIKIVEGMRKCCTYCEKSGISGDCWKANRNQALDDLLLRLRGSSNFSEFMRGEDKEETMLEVAKEATNDQRAQIGLPPLQGEIECCKKCEIPGTRHSVSNCPCHKPRTEETFYDKLNRHADASCENFARKMDKAGIALLEETEKEGASFSGRECVEFMESRCPLCPMSFKVPIYKDIEAVKEGAGSTLGLELAEHLRQAHREGVAPQSRAEKFARMLRERPPKEPTTPQEYTKDGRLVIPKPAPSKEDIVLVTPQSREQGGEKLFEGKRIVSLLNLALQNENLSMAAWKRIADLNRLLLGYASPED